VYQAAVSRAVAGLNGAKANEANSKARLEQAKARYINADRNFKRQEKLNKDGVISDADFDAVKSEYEVAVAEVNAAEESLHAAEFNIKSAQATVKEANDNLKRTTIYAPLDGTVSMLNVENGERVVGTAQMAGTEMLRVADLTQMEVNVEVNESDIVRVKLGDKATVEVDAYLNRKFEGVVTEISNSSANNNMGNTNEITVFNVKVRILRSSYEDLIDPKNPHLSPFRPGMSANVDITTKELKEIIMVPIQAVAMRPEAKKEDRSKYKVDLDEYTADELFEVVFVIENDTAKMVKVTTGIQDTKNIQIISGLTEGQQVVTGPYSIVSSKLIDGQTVEVKSKSDLYSEEEEE
jgi:HlyD family secretion protein